MSEADREALRPVMRTVKGMRTSDGAGVALKRILGSPELEMLDPFLLLDEFRSDQDEPAAVGCVCHFSALGL